MEVDPDDEINRVTDGVLRAVLANRSAASHSTASRGGLVEGYLGTRLLAGRYEIFYDPALLDADELRKRIRVEIGDTTDPLDFQPAGHSSRQLAELLRRIGRRDWHPAAKRIAFAFGLNAPEAVVEVQLDESATTDVLLALERLGVDVIRVTAEGHVGRRGSS